MAFKAKITEISEVEQNLQQSASFDILNANDKIITSGSARGDVEQLPDIIKSIVTDFELKYKSGKKLKVGDILEV
jgi:hypothetical protein